MEHEIDRRHRQQGARQAADDERDHEADGKQHRRPKHDPATEHCEQPIEDLYARRHRDDRRHDSEESVNVGARSHGEEMMQPDHVGEDTNPERCPNHRAITEQPLAGKGRDDFGKDAECGQDQYVDLGMPPRPEQVDIHHLVAAGVIGKEMHAEVTVEQQHHEGRRQNRERGDNQQVCGQRGPAEHWHAEISHAGGAQFENRCHEINAGQQGADARDLY